MKSFLATMFLLLAATITMAQEPSASESKAVPVKADATQLETSSILILVNESQPSQIIVYDASGTWLADIREMKITIDLLGSGITANCVLWRGALRPTTPRTITVTIKEMKSISAEAFTERLANLNAQ